LKTPDLNWIIQGDQPYWYFPLSKDSVLRPILSKNW